MVTVDFLSLYVPGAQNKKRRSTTVSDLFILFTPMQGTILSDEDKDFDWFFVRALEPVMHQLIMVK